MLHNDAMKGKKKKKSKKILQQQICTTDTRKDTCFKGGGGKGGSPRRCTIISFCQIKIDVPFVTVQLYDGARTIVCCCLHFAIQSSVPLEIKCCLLFIVR